MASQCHRVDNKECPCRRPLRGLRCGSCCWHTFHPSLGYIAPAVLATYRSHITSHPPLAYIASAARIHCTRLSLIDTPLEPRLNTERPGTRVPRLSQNPERDTQLKGRKTPIVLSPPVISS